MRVGFIGLGSQGGPMARRIVDAGYPLALWARRPRALEPFSGTSAKAVGSPAELAAASNLVCLCVVGDDDVEQVTSGADGVFAGLAPGSVLAVHSTVHPDTCRRLAEHAAERNIGVVDAPVSGGGGAATEGNLLVMAGGEAEDVERCRPVFATYGDPVVHLGAVGAGQLTKLLNNLLFTANLATAAGTLDLARSLGIEPGRLGEVITRGTANSFALGRVAGAGGTLDRIAEHAGALLRKDVALVSELAELAGAPRTPVQDTAEETLRLMGF